MPDPTIVTIPPITTPDGPWEPIEGVPGLDVSSAQTPQHAPPDLPPENTAPVPNPCKEDPELCKIPPWPGLPDPEPVPGPAENPAFTPPAPTPQPAPPDLPPENTAPVPNPCKEDPELCKIPPWPGLPEPDAAPTTTITSLTAKPVPTAEPRTAPTSTTIAPVPTEPVPTIEPQTAEPVPTIEPQTAEPVPTIEPQTAEPVPTAPPRPTEPSGSTTLDLSATSTRSGDVGMSCQTLDCAIDFVNWCNDSGGSSHTAEGPGDGWEMNCDLP